MSSRRGPPTVVVLVATLLVTLCSFAWLNKGSADPPMLGTDASVWVDLARDCLELGRCHTRGASSSNHLDTGVAWVDVLMLVQLFHGTSLAERVVVFALLAVGVGTLFNVLWRWLGLAVAVPAALATVGTLRHCEDPARVWNSSASFFPNALCFAALLVFAWTRRPLALCVAAVFMSISLNMHLSALALVPSVVLVAVVVSERPAAAVAMALGVGLIASGLIASGSTLANLSALPTVLPLGILLGTTVGFVALAALVRLGQPRFLRASDGARGVWVSLAVLLPWVALFEGLRVIARQPFLSAELGLLTSTYGLVVIAPVAALVGILPVYLVDTVTTSVRLVPWGSTLARVFIAGLATVAVQRYLTIRPPPMDTHPRLSREDGRTIDRRLEARGWDYERLVDRLQSRNCQNLLAGIVTYAGRPTRPPTNLDPFTQVRVWILPDASVPTILPPDMERLTLRDRRTAIISPIRSWFDVSQEAYCQPGATAMHCAPLPPQQGPASEFLFSHRGYLWYPPGTRIPTVDEAIAVPLVATTETREISVHSGGSCPWRPARVEGLAFTRTASPDTIRVDGQDGVTGRLWIERAQRDCPYGWDPQPPCLMERRSQEPEIFLRGDVAQ